MKYSKNIIATVLVCAAVSTVGFAAAKSPLWTLNGKAVQTEVCKILGGKGKLESSNKAYFFDDDDEAIADTYVWKKKGNYLATIRIKFINEVIQDIDDCSYHDWS